jgi:ribose transport system ATP-binding protein
MTSRSRQPVLQARHITKTFPGVVALDGVDLDVHAGEVLAIVGENGAGKSTLMNILSGVYDRYEGTILLDGVPTAFSGPRDAQDRGIAIIHQELNLVPCLSVAENIFLGREFVGAAGIIDYGRMHAETTRLLNRLDLDIPPDTQVDELRVGSRQVVEIARALSLDARVIIMDEPTSAITDTEVEALFTLVRSLKEKGVAIMYITHKLDELPRIADRLTVLRDGKCISTAPVEQMTHDDIVRMMVGRNANDFFVKEQAAILDEVLRIDHLTVPHPTRAGDFLVNDVTFSIRHGEVLGVFGLMGAGRTELCEAIFGASGDRISGDTLVDGEHVRITSPGDAIAAGIGYVPEDRKQAGLVVGMTIAENVSMAGIERVERLGFLSDNRERALADVAIQQLNIRTTGPDQIVEKLSGGNQQKVVIAKWLSTSPRVLLLDEPTRGIDVGAKNEIYQLIGDLAAEGIGIMFISSELPEILSISDRIMTMCEGCVTGEFMPDEATEELLLAAAIPKRKEGAVKTPVPTPM